MKNLIALFLAGFATLAVAGETSTVQPATVEHYLRYPTGYCAGGQPVQHTQGV